MTIQRESIPDIRRKINTKHKKIVGLELAEAVKQVADEMGSQYVKASVIGYKGKASYHHAILFNLPKRDVILRTSDELQNTDIHDDTLYEQIGVGSTSWVGTGYTSLNVPIDVKPVIEAVEEVRDKLEEKL